MPGRESGRDAELLALVGDLRHQQAALCERIEAIESTTERDWARLKAQADEAASAFKELYAKAMLIRAPD